MTLVSQHYTYSHSIQLAQRSMMFALENIVRVYFNNSDLLDVDIIIVTILVSSIIAKQLIRCAIVILVGIHYTYNMRPFHLYVHKYSVDKAVGHSYSLL